MTSVAVLGTGLLGTAIATRLLEQGLNVYVWNRDPVSYTHLTLPTSYPV